MNGILCRCNLFDQDLLSTSEDGDLLTRQFSLSLPLEVLRIGAGDLVRVGRNEMEQQRVLVLRGNKWMSCDDYVEHWRALA